MQTILILLAVSLDVFSFGISLGIDKVNLNWYKALYFTFISMLIFSIPLALSKLIATIVAPKICYIINGSVLIAMGIFYLICFVKNCLKKASKKVQNSPNSLQNTNSHGIIQEKDKSGKLGLKSLAICAIPVNLDAFFTALLSGFSMGNFFIVLAIYLVFTFLAVYLANKISFFLTKRLQLDLSWLSAILFIVLGVFKILEAF